MVLLSYELQLVLWRPCDVRYRDSSPWQPSRDGLHHQSWQEVGESGPPAFGGSAMGGRRAVPCSKVVVARWPGPASSPGLCDEYRTQAREQFESGLALT
jgi:hypothetical protein